jgi:peptidoglycan/LPS O-acetylase OafA/YrhL
VKATTFGVSYAPGYIALLLLEDALSGAARKTSFPLLLVANAALAGWTMSVAFSRRTLSQRLLRGNDVSYGLYIYHMLVVNLFVHHRAFGQLRYVLLAAAVALAVAALSWRLVEAPALKLKSSARARSHRWSTPPLS